MGEKEQLWNRIGIRISWGLNKSQGSRSFSVSSPFRELDKASAASAAGGAGLGDQ